MTVTTNSEYGYGNFGPPRSDVDTFVFDLGLYKSNALNDIMKRHELHPLFSKDVEKGINKKMNGDEHIIL